MLSLAQHLASNKVILKEASFGKPDDDDNYNNSFKSWGTGLAVSHPLYETLHTYIQHNYT